MGQVASVEESLKARVGQLLDEGKRKPDEFALELGLSAPEAARLVLDVMDERGFPPPSRVPEALSRLKEAIDSLDRMG